MDINEKLEKEKQNLSAVILYGDKSNFLHAYEHSAFAFVTFIRRFKPVVVRRKDGVVYCYVGFQADRLSGYLEGKGLSVQRDEGNGTVTIQLTQGFSDEDFQRWKNVTIVENLKEKGSIKEENIPVNVTPVDTHNSQTVKTAAEEKNPENPLADEICSLQLSKMSPIKALNYLVRLQKRLQHERRQQQ